jgi:hypothetical protein
LQPHLTKRRKNFIKYITTTDFYKKRASKLDNEIDEVLKISPWEGCKKRPASEKPQSSAGIIKRIKTSVSGGSPSPYLMSKEVVKVGNSLIPKAKYLQYIEPSSVTYHHKLDSGEYSTINALALLPDSKIPKRDAKGQEGKDFIHKISKYLKRLKSRKSEKRIKKLKAQIKEMDYQRRSNKQL